MGCTSSREKLESQMLTLNMRKADIQQEREEHLEKLTKLTGIPVTRKPVKDYLIIPKLGCKETKNLTQLLAKKKSKNTNNKKPKQPMKSIMKNKSGIKTSEKSTSDFTYISKNKNKNVKEESQSSEDDSESESDESERKYKSKKNSNHKNKSNKYKKKEYSNSSEEIDEESSDESGKSNSEESYDYED